MVYGFDTMIRFVAQIDHSFIGLESKVLPFEIDVTLYLDDGGSTGIHCDLQSHKVDYAHYFFFIAMKEELSRDFSFILQNKEQFQQMPQE